MKNGNGKIRTNRDEIASVVESFYQQHYKNAFNYAKYEILHIQNRGSENITEVTEDEVEQALGEIKNNKSPGENGTVTWKSPSNYDKLFESLTEFRVDSRYIGIVEQIYSQATSVCYRGIRETICLQKVATWE